MFPCHICDVKLNSIEQKRAHCRGKNHVKRMAARDKAIELGTDFDSTPDHCDVCNVPLTSKMTAIDHFKGKMHQKKVKTTEDLRQGFQHYCEVCDVKLQSLKVSEAHFNGKQHRKRERKSCSRGKEKSTPGSERKPRVINQDCRNPTSFYAGNSHQNGSTGSASWESLNCEKETDSKDILSEFRSILSGKSNSPESSHTGSPLDSNISFFSFDEGDIAGDLSPTELQPKSQPVSQQFSDFPSTKTTVNCVKPTTTTTIAAATTFAPIQPKTSPSCTQPNHVVKPLHETQKPVMWTAVVPSYPNGVNDPRFAYNSNAKTPVKSEHERGSHLELVTNIPRVLHALTQIIYPMSSSDIACNLGFISPSEVNTVLAHLEKYKMVTITGHSPILWSLAPHIRKQNNGAETKIQNCPPNLSFRPENVPKGTLIESSCHPKTSGADLVKNSAVTDAFATRQFPHASLSSPTTHATTTTTSPVEAIQGIDVFESNLINLLQQSGPTSALDILKRLNFPDETKLVFILQKLFEQRVITTDNETPQRWRLVNGTRFSNVGVIGGERKRKSPVQNGFISNETPRERTPSPPQQNGLVEPVLNNGFCVKPIENGRKSPACQEKNAFIQSKTHNIWLNFNGNSLNGLSDQSRLEQNGFQENSISSNTENEKSTNGATEGTPSTPIQTETTKFLYDLTETAMTSYQREVYEQAMQEDLVCYLPTGTGKGVVLASVAHHMLALNPTKQALVVVEDTITALELTRRLRKELGSKTKENKLNVSLYAGQLKQSNGKNQVVVVTSSTCLRLLNCGALSWKDVCLLVFDRADLCTGDSPSHQIVRDYYMRTKSECRGGYLPKLLGFLDCTAAVQNFEGTVQRFHAVLGNMGDIFLAGVSQFKDELEESKSEAMFVCVPASLTQEEERVFCVIHNYLVLVFENLAAQWQPLNSYRELFELSFQKQPIDGEAFGKLVRLTGQPLEKRLPQSCLKTWRHYQAICEVMLALVECGEDFALELLSNLIREPFNLAWASDAGLPANELSLHMLTTGLPKKTSWGSNGHNLQGSGVRELLEQLTIIQWENARVSSERPLALVIVKLSKTAKMLAGYLARCPELAKRNVKTAFLDGTRSSHQKTILSAIRRRQYQVIISTDELEDSLDLPVCELVVLLDQPSTLSALARLRKRQAANVVAICRGEDGEKDLKELLKKEEVVETVVRYIRGVDRSCVS